MTGLSDWFDPNSAGGILAIIFGSGVVIVLGTVEPGVLMGLATLAFLAWVGVRTGLVDGDSGESDGERDPLTVLQERYARGELPEEEFERRVERVIETDARAGRSDDRERETERV